MLARKIKVIIGALTICMLLTGIAIANPGHSFAQKEPPGKAVDGKNIGKGTLEKNVLGNVGVNCNQEKKKPGERNGLLNATDTAPLKEKLKNKLESTETKKRGSVSGLTVLDGTTGSTTVTTSSPLGNVQLRLYELKKNKKGFDRVKTVYAAKSNKEGKYEFKNVKVGSYVLAVWSPIAAPISESTVSVSVEASTTTNVPDIHFVKLGTVTGKVLLDTSETTLSAGNASDTSSTTTTVTGSKPLANAHLRLYTRVKAKKGYMLFMTEAAVKTDSNGNFTFKNVRPGKYIVKVWSPTAIPVSDKYIEVTAEINKTVTIPDIHMKARPVDVKPIDVFKGGRQKH
jgi:hypothetical protein